MATPGISQNADQSGKAGRSHEHGLCATTSPLRSVTSTSGRVGPRHSSTASSQHGLLWHHGISESSCETWQCITLGLPGHRHTSLGPAGGVLLTGLVLRVLELCKVLQAVQPRNPDPPFTDQT
jgi:hypothetical protein